MRIGVGLPAAVPNADARIIGGWASEAERAGFASVGVIDRLVYDNLEPLTALAAAAARTERIELFTTVLNVGWRANPVLLAKQMASVDLLSAGRLTAGLGLGGWPEDFEVSRVPTVGAGARLRSALATMHQVWAGEIVGQGGPTRRLAVGRPALLFGGLVPAAHIRAATEGQGWVAPLFGLEVLKAGAAAVRRAWAEAGRTGAPRIVTGRYFSLGRDADRVADDYIRHYYLDDSSSGTCPPTSIRSGGHGPNPSSTARGSVPSPGRSSLTCDPVALGACSSREARTMLVGLLSRRRATREACHGDELLQRRHRHGDDVFKPTGQSTSRIHSSFGGVAPAPVTFM